MAHFFKKREKETEKEKVKSWRERKNETEISGQKV